MKKISLALLASVIAFSTGCVNAQPTNNTVVPTTEAVDTTKTIPVEKVSEGIYETKDTKILFPTNYIQAMKYLTNPKTTSVLYDTAELPTMEKNGKAIDKLYLNFPNVVISPVKSTEYLKYGSIEEHQKVDFTKKLNIFFQPNNTLTNLKEKLHLHQALVDDMLRVANHTKDERIKGYGNTEAAKSFFNAYASEATVPVMYLEVKDLHDIPDYISILTRDGDIQTRAMIAYANGKSGALYTDYYGFDYTPEKYVIKNNNEVLGLTSSSKSFTAEGKANTTAGLKYRDSFTDGNVETLILGINLTDDSCDVANTGYGHTPTMPYIGYLIVHKVK